MLICRNCGSKYQYKKFPGSYLKVVCQECESERFKYIEKYSFAWLLHIMRIKKVTK